MVPAMIAAFELPTCPQKTFDAMISSKCWGPNDAKVKAARHGLIKLLENPSTTLVTYMSMWSVLPSRTNMMLVAEAAVKHAAPHKIVRRSIDVLSIKSPA